MKSKLFLLSIIMPLIIYSQNQLVKDTYKNGQVKTEHIFNKDKLEIIKTYHKNGQLKFQKYINDSLIEEYYKNGQLSYRKSQNEKQLLEEAYSKNGDLIIRLINNEIITINVLDIPTKIKVFKLIFMTSISWMYFGNFIVQ